MRVIAIDTETARIRPGLLAPPLTCLTWAERGAVPGICLHEEAVSRVRAWLLDADVTLVGLNIAYDLAVCAAEAPELLPSIFAAYTADRVTDVGVRQKLIDLANGAFRGEYDADADAFIPYEYSVAALTQRYFGIELDKSTHRLRFGELRGLPVDQWPDGAASYALDDAEHPLEIYWLQQKHAQYLDDQYRQARAEWSLHLESCWGMRTSAAAIDAFAARVTEEYGVALETCKAHGFVRADNSRDTKATKRSMIAVMEALDAKPKRTKTHWQLMRKRDKEGLTEKEQKKIEDPLFGISLDEEACLASGDAALQAYSRVSSLKTIIEKRIDQLRNGITTPIQPRFETLVATGRIACKGYSEESPVNSYQVLNVNRQPGLRECFVPRDGHLYLIADYDGLELRTVSQVCISVLGYSELAKALNAGEDVHSSLGAQVLGCSYGEVLERTRGGDKEAKDARQFSKIGNFGLWGCMGAAAFRAYARLPKNGGMHKTLEECKALIHNFKARWVEAPEYFRWVNSLMIDGLACIVQLGSDRQRADIKYTVACNGFFQGLGADATKDALFCIQKECYADPSSPLYGCRTVNYVYDEFILEVPDSPSAYRPAAERLREIMVERAGAWLPDVPPTTTPCVARCWSKNAKAVYNDNKELIPWEPKT